MHSRSGFVIVVVVILGFFFAILLGAEIYFFLKYGRTYPFVLPQESPRTEVPPRISAPPLTTSSVE